jgi:phosphoglycerate dehydrogenase-like enzyme
MSASPHPRVVIAASSVRHVAEGLRRLGGIDVVERPDLADTASEQQLVEGLAGAWAVVAGSEVYSRAAFEQFDALRAIFRFGVGYDAVDVAAATDYDVAVVTTPGANAEAVADMALMLMLACIRGLPTLESAVRTGSWRPRTPSRDLALATVAIVGLGAIGRAVARRLHGFGCELLAVEPALDRDFCAELGIEALSLDDALARADVVTLHAALTPATRHLLGARELALLSPHAVVVNTSRGGLIDEAALVDALTDGRLAAAGLDVFEKEPLNPGEALLALSNVIVTGHVSSFTELATRLTSDAVVDHVAALLAGIRPEGCLNSPPWISNGAPVANGE